MTETQCGYADCENAAIGIGEPCAFHSELAERMMWAPHLAFVRDYVSPGVRVFSPEAHTAQQREYKAAHRARILLRERAYDKARRHSRLAYNREYLRAWRMRKREQSRAIHTKPHDDAVGILPFTPERA